MTPVTGLHRRWRSPHRASASASSAGLLEPGSGWLEIDGERATPETLAGLQRTIGYVPQDVYLAHDTLRANIALGLDEVDPARLEWACRTARLHDFVMSCRKATTLWWASVAFA